MKKRSWFWFIIQLLPFFLLVVWAVSHMQSTSINNLSDFKSAILVFFDGFSFAPVLLALARVYLAAFGEVPTDGVYFVMSLASYEVCVLLLRICYEVIAFLPKFCISVFERKKGD